MDENYHLILDVPSVDWGDDRWAEKNWRLNEKSGSFSEFKFLILSQKNAGDDVRSKGIQLG
jgi:hypothetical protein